MYSSWSRMEIACMVMIDYQTSQVAEGGEELNFSFRSSTWRVGDGTLTRSVPTSSDNGFNL